MSASGSPRRRRRSARRRRGRDLPRSPSRAAAAARRPGRRRPRPCRPRSRPRAAIRPARRPRRPRSRRDRRARRSRAAGWPPTASRRRRSAPSHLSRPRSCAEPAGRPGRPARPCRRPARSPRRRGRRPRSRRRWKRRSGRDRRTDRRAGGIRATVPSAARTQVPASPVAIASASSPRTVATTRSVRGSIRDTAWSGPITQTASGSTATWSSESVAAAGPLRGSGVRARTVEVVGSTRATAVPTGPAVCSPRTWVPVFTQSEPAPLATSIGVEPTPKVETSPESPSTRVIVWRSASSAQTPLASALTAAGAPPTSTPSPASPVVAEIA